jgi:hypothetical protein
MTCAVQRATPLALTADSPQPALKAELASPRRESCREWWFLDEVDPVPTAVWEGQLASFAILSGGEVSEWLMVPLSKSGVRKHRGFESRPLRHPYRGERPMRA